MKQSLCPCFCHIKSPTPMRCDLCGRNFSTWIGYAEHLYREWKKRLAK